MVAKRLHTLVLGAGPAGLAAGYTLARLGHSPMVLDRDIAPGGLMRSVRRGAFSVDIGRKELYNRLDRVDAFWGELLGEDYRSYPHRGGYLYEGHILEMSPAYKGVTRGMPALMFARCIAGFISARLGVLRPAPTTVEEYFYRSRGRLLTRVASQGFQEKLAGQKWSELTLAPNDDLARTPGLISTLRGAIARAWSTKEVNTFEGRWRHPAKGTGQICDALASGIVHAGGTMALGTKLLAIETRNNRVVSVTAEIASQEVVLLPDNVASSIPFEAAIRLLGKSVPDSYTQAAGKPSRRRTVVLVYLFLDRTTLFPQAWLQVTCPSTRIGRITNYAGFDGEMVPPGLGCLCCEYYCYGADPLLEMSEATLVADTVSYCERAGLITAGSVTDRLVLKLPGADASQNRHNWITSLRLGLLAEVAQVTNFYHIGRTDLDIATLAGIEAAEAIVSGDRTTFDRHLDPEQIGIRSEKKPFEFIVPPTLPIHSPA